MDYLNLLEHSFDIEKAHRHCAPKSRLAFLSESIFNFTTYDSEIDELFATKAVETCAAINNGTTFSYIKKPENYRWFLIMCNMPFFENKLEWGTSIRDAWWSARPGRHIELDSCGLWVGVEQFTETLKFNNEQWKIFVSAVIKFAGLKS